MESQSQSSPPQSRVNTGNNNVMKFLWTGLIVLSWVIALWVPLYNRMDPQIFGVPFFYWFQVFMIIVAAIITSLAFKFRV